MAPGRTPPEDIFALLHRDHLRIARLMEQIAAADGDADRRGRLFLDLKNALDARSEAEQNVFYDALRDVEHLRDQLGEAIAEQADITDVLEELADTSDEETWRVTFVELREAVERHVSNEEAKLFPMARRILSPIQTLQLARAMELEVQRIERAA
jgi:hypothetical protein